MTAPDQPPQLRIINADATDEEVAAIVAALAAVGAPMTRTRRGSEWAAPDRAVRVRYSHGAGGWLSSSRPR